MIPPRALRISKKAGKHPPLGEGIQATKKRLAQDGKGYVANAPTCGPLLILCPTSNLLFCFLCRIPIILCSFGQVADCA